MTDATLATPGSAAPAQEYPTLAEATRVWARVALLSLGGPAGQIAVMHRILVEEKRWLGDGRFLHALNFCMLLPGPEAQQLATWIGWRLHGWRGGLAAGLLFVIPGALVILVLSALYAVAVKVNAQYSAGRENQPGHDVDTVLNAVRLPDDGNAYCQRHECQHAAQRPPYASSPVIIEKPLDGASSRS